MCYIQVKNIRLNSFYEEKKIKLCLTKQLLNMFKLWCEWGISLFTNLKDLRDMLRNKPSRWLKRRLPTG